MPHCGISSETPPFTCFLSKKSFKQVWNFSIESEFTTLFVQLKSMLFPFKKTHNSYYYKSKIFMRILFSQIMLKDIHEFATLKIRD